MEIRLDNLKPGDRFRCGDMTGTLIYANYCRAYVELDTTPKTIQFTDRHGKTKTYVAAKGKSARKSFAPECLVEKLEATQ